jgi:DNA-binding MarR family transcriptional regulator
MSEAHVLSYIRVYPHPTALARHLRDGSLFPLLRRLEARGLVWRERGQYRLTSRGRNELAIALVLVAPDRLM